MIDEKVVGNQWNVLLNRIGVDSSTIISKSLESRMNKVNIQIFGPGCGIISRKYKYNQICRQYVHY